LLESQCAGPFYLPEEIQSGATYQDYESFALVAEPLVQVFGAQTYIYTSTTIARSGLGVEFEKRRTILGIPTLTHKQSIRDDLGIRTVDFVRHADWVTVRFSCDTRESQAKRLAISVERSVLVETLYAPFGPFWNTGYILNYSQISTGFVPHACVVDPALVCNLSIYTPPSLAYAQTPLEDAVVSWDNSRAYYKGSGLSDWAYATAPASVFPWFAPEKRPSDVPESLDDWMGGGSVPLAGQVTLKRKASCQPTAPCDCTQSLDGMTVTFEGQTFTYGALQEFFSGDGITRWIELLPGLFTRYDYDPCDPSQFFAASTITAEVFCTTVDGQGYWGVEFQRQCAERSVCQPATDAERTTTWSGLFDCSSDGKPTGNPHSAASPSQPPDLDSDVISGGTPTGDCAGTPAIPSFSFS
jgi:hypothetical protein